MHDHKISFDLTSSVIVVASSVDVANLEQKKNQNQT